MDWSYPFRFVRGLIVLAIRTALTVFEGLCFDIYLRTWDLYLVIDNWLSPNRDPNKVIPPGAPGYMGDWSLNAYIPPTANDSRSPCPALNALANHGILHRDGKNISYSEISKAAQLAYNLSPTLTLRLTMILSKLFGRDYWEDRMDLGDLNAHNVIEHDASILRADTFFQRDQGVPSVDLIDRLLQSASGVTTIGQKKVKILTAKDVAAYTRLRRRESKETNGQYNITLVHKIFAANNNSIMGEVFGGRLDDLRAWLIEERFQQGWQPCVLAKNGLTLLGFEKGTLDYYLMQDPLPYLDPLDGHAHRD